MYDALRPHHRPDPEALARRSRSAVRRTHRARRAVRLLRARRGRRGFGYDVAVFLWDLREGDLADRWRELDRLAGLRSEILSDTGAFIDAKPDPAGAHRDRMGLMSEIRRDGVEL